jgi:putative heme-binding domain-containing protein
MLRIHLSGMWQQLADDEAIVTRIGKALSDDALRPALLTIVGEARLGGLAGDVVKVARDESLDATVRLEALGVLATLGASDSAASLPHNLKDDDATIREATLNTLVALGDFGTLRCVVTGDMLSADGRKALTKSLLATHGGALVLLKEIDADTLAAELRELVIADVADHPDANIRELYEAYLPADKIPPRLGDEVSPDEILALTGDAERGEQVFRRGSAARCVDCHRVGDRGERLGPELDAIGTKYERAALLETILNPSKAIAPEFVPHVVETDSGLVYLGLVTSRDDNEVSLLDSERKQRTIPVNEITTIEAQSKSLMPDLVLRDVSAQDAADLLAFLLTLRAPAGDK